MLSHTYRSFTLRIAEAAPIARFIKKQGWRLGVGRFVAGETLDEVLPRLHGLEQEGLKSILDLLGEFVDTEAGVEVMVTDIMLALEALGQQPIDRHMSVKPTQLGLGIDLQYALANTRQILSQAREVNAHVCLDMENSAYAEGTLVLFRTLYEEGYLNVSTVLQSYLYRSKSDLLELLELQPKPAVRIVKGAYRESAEVAYQDKARVDESYDELVVTGLKGGAKISVATHDERIIAKVSDFVRAANVEASRYEFQLLYGVKPNLQRRLIREGHPVRIYVPYGKDWYGYFSRRLAERPANLMFVIRGLLG